MSTFLSKYIKFDFRFWLFVFFLIRLIGISNPPIEANHNWRQSLTNMVARNYVEEGLDLFHPKIDMAGDDSGIIGSEFPFFNYLIYLVSMVFGYQHWYGRLINLIVSSLGVLAFQKLIVGVSSKKVGEYAGYILLFSLWFSFSRKIMPDTFSVALVLIGLYFSYRFLSGSKWYYLFFYFIFITLGILCKIPAIGLLSVLIVVPFIPSIPMKKLISFIGVSIVGVGISFWWYFYWVPYLVETYHFQLFFTKGLVEGAKEISAFLPKLMEKFYFTTLSSFIAFGVTLAGVFILIRSKDKLVKVAVISFFIVFAIYILKTGAVFPNHNYYTIPLTPMFAFLAALFLVKIPQKYATILIVVIAIESIGNQQHDFYYSDDEDYMVELELVMDQTIDRNDMIIVGTSESPQMMYFAHRKGWIFNRSKIENEDLVESTVQKGAKYIVVDNNKYKEELPYPIIYKDKSFKIYSLTANH